MMILPCEPPFDYLPDPRLIVFDSALAGLQDVPREVAAYVLPMIAPVLIETDPEYPDIFMTALDIPPPEDAPIALRYWQSIRAGDTIKSCPLLKWMDDETGTLPLVRQAMHAAAAIINRINTITQSGQEADSTRGTAS